MPALHYTILLCVPLDVLTRFGTVASCVSSVCQVCITRTRAKFLVARPLKRKGWLSAASVPSFQVAEARIVRGNGQQFTILETSAAFGRRIRSVHLGYLGLMLDNPDNLHSVEQASHTVSSVN
ncbi:predicted protein [Histoplasma capsulatum var. duboisii H88]|uniref:Predicted protein n=2 Tax=Ajellomyces capsulatus TaxID=5037 RepID=F0UQT7_AJEC8|nr:predicted protein [Histoplasma capsulatum H143]EGC48264.1 predicted protein [Histoplasma capsulatum var. duboisii H88]